MVGGEFCHSMLYVEFADCQHPPGFGRDGSGNRAGAMQNAEFNESWRMEA
jgi:hypothetical protein